MFEVPRPQESSELTTEVTRETCTRVEQAHTARASVQRALRRPAGGSVAPDGHPTHRALKQGGETTTQLRDENKMSRKCTKRCRKSP